MHVIEDLHGKGGVGLPAVPGASSEAQKRKMRDPRIGELLCRAGAGRTTGAMRTGRRCAQAGMDCLRLQVLIALWVYVQNLRGSIVLSIETVPVQAANGGKAPWAHSSRA